MMTRKARALGMTHTTYRNPNGLPDDEQITTARDQAMLGIAIQERFPKYYRYFSTPSFVYPRQRHAQPQPPARQVEGVDGIKTGYTRDSGFNLVTSVRRGPRQSSPWCWAAARRAAATRACASLIDEHIAEASTKAADPPWSLRRQRPDAPAARPQRARRPKALAARQ